MYTRFTDIVNTLEAQGKTFSNSKKVKKIIRLLPKEWRSKRIVIDEAKYLNILPIDDLISSLISYKEDLAVEKDNEERRKVLLSKPQNIRVIRKASWMMRRWICWLGDSGNSTRKLVSKESSETTIIKRRRTIQLLAMNAKSLDTYDRSVLSSTSSRKGNGSHME